MSKEPYTGDTERLVISFDIGTTYSGASVCLLKPGEPPSPVPVASYPGLSGASTAKIPTIVCYDAEGKVICIGAECELDHNIPKIEAEGAIKVEWFKLRMCPGKTSKSVRDAAAERAVIPKGKDILQIYADFMAYMLECTKEFFGKRFPRGQETWESLFPSAHFIVGHPNGWEGAPQAKMRKAAVIGKLVPDTVADRARIHFVTEGEASLHFCLDQGSVDEAKEADNRGFILADFGGGTIDLSTYKVTALEPLCVSEVVEAKCLVQGATIVTTRARKFLEEQLGKSVYGEPESMSRIMSHFDKTTKCRFRKASDGPSIVAFGGMRDTDKDLGIERGNLKIQGTDMAAFFEPSLQESVDAIKEIKKLAQGKDVLITSVYLVGGFSASNYLISELQSRLESSGIRLYVPDAYRAKAVAEGAIQYYIRHIVQARVAKWTYGTRAAVRYDPSDPQHIRRQDDVEMTSAGLKFVGGKFDAIVKKGTVVNSTETFMSKYSSIASKRSELEVSGMPIIVYTGEGPPPEWLDEDPDHFRSIMRVRGDEVKPPANIGIGPNGALFWHSSYKIVIKVGLTEMEAYYTWEDDGVEHQTRGEIIYDEFLENEDDDDIDVNLLRMFMRALARARSASGDDGPPSYPGPPMGREASI